MWWERVTGGRDWEQGARGQPSALCKYGRGCPGFLLGAWPMAVPHLLVPRSLPSYPSHLFCCESGAARLHPGLFRPSERKKENSITKNSLCQPEIPKDSTRQKGGKEQEEHGFPTSRGSSRSPGQGTSASRPHTPCAGHKPLLRSIPDQGIVPVSPHQAPHLPDSLLWEAPQPWHIQQQQGKRQLPVLPGFCMAVPRGWHQQCLSPNLKAMRTSLQQ